MIEVLSKDAGVASRTRPVRPDASQPALQRGIDFYLADGAACLGIAEILSNRALVDFYGSVSAVGSFRIVQTPQGDDP